MHSRHRRINNCTTRLVVDCLSTLSTLAKNAYSTSVSHNSYRSYVKTNNDNNTVQLIYWSFMVEQCHRQHLAAVVSKNNLHHHTNVQLTFWMDFLYALWSIANYISSGSVSFVHSMRSSSHRFRRHTCVLFQTTTTFLRLGWLEEEAKKWKYK